MSPDQAMFNEANISRTLAVDALAGRCAQLAGERAEFENQVAALTGENIKLNSRITELLAEIEGLKKRKKPLKVIKEP